MNEQAPVICVDGPSGSGKGTVCRALVRALDWHLLDSGALYRVVALAGRARGVATDDSDGLVAVAQQMNVRFAVTDDDDERILLDDVDMTREVRSEKTGELASQVAVLPALRTALVGRQQAFRQPPGLVADGRDMGTVIFPDGELKVFLTASAEERAQRRHKQLKEMGFDASLAKLAADIRARDERDAGRAVAPLVPADDAVTIDTTGVPVAQVVDRVLAMASERGLRP